MKAEQFQPFDPESPDDIVADHFRKAVMENYLHASAITLFRDLSAQRKFEAFMAGSLTGVMVVMFSHFKKERRGEAFDAMKEMLDEVRLGAEGILDMPPGP